MKNSNFDFCLCVDKKIDWRIEQVYMIEKKENLPLYVVISLMDLSIYLYLLAYLKSNKPVYFLFQSYCSFLDTHVNFLPVMYEELCDEHLVRSLRYNM